VKLYIPEIGDQLRLTADWTFGLYNEHRNETLMEKISDTRKSSAWGNDYAPIPCTIPSGAVLKVDRIYIRKGISEYSSVSFLWVGERTEPKVEHWNATTIKTPRKPVRFWAKLVDVNNIEFEKV